ncbi:MAG: glycosyltransferase family A protein [Bacteroidota bacterium]|nr:glycosyltransferase family A protein [Bacteroidota bacterium]MDP3146802.1 glycosyltransferase family A protein [Bacteroidota bacterium]
MNSTILVTILMAVKDAEFTLVKRAIDSVLNQDFKDFEFIVIDDGSVGDYKNDLLNYANQCDKIKYVYHANCGQSESINKGVLMSSGKYIAIIDADDEYKVNHLTKCLQEMSGADLIASTTQTVVDREEDYFVPDKKNPSKLIHVDDCILFATLFGKKEVFEKVKFESRYAADALFFENASKKFKTQKVDLRTYIYYRNNPTSISAVLKEKFSKSN